MKGKIVLLIAVMVLSLGLVGTPASWANSLTYNNVTFNMAVNVDGNLDLNIVNATNATGNWAGISTLNAFAINNFGDATGLSVDNWTTVPGGLNSSGCSGSGGHVCFNISPGFSLTDNFTLEILKTGGAFNLNLSDGEGLFGPHLKVFFDGANVPNAHGDLLSQTVSTPEPSSLMLLGAAFAGLGIWRRKALQV